MASPAFGFSVGDFVAGIELITKVAKALRTVNGAAARYQQTVLELESVEALLRRVQAFYSRTSDQDLVRNVQLCGLLCHAPLAKFFEKIRKFEATLTYTPVSSVPLLVGRAGRKVQWAVVVEDEVAKLKASIGPQLTTIGLYLQLDASNQAASLQHSVDASLSDVKQLLADVNSLKAYLYDEVATDQHVAAIVSLLDQKSSHAQRERAQILSVAQDTQACSAEILRMMALQERFLLDSFRRPDTVQNQTTLLSDVDAKPLRRHTSTLEDNHLYHIQKTKRAITDVDRQGQVPEQVLAFVEAVSRGLTEVILILLTLLPAFQRVLRTLSAISRAPKMLMRNNIYFEDCLGRTVTLPFEHFRFWPVFQARLNCEFRGLPGERSVKRRRFEMIRVRADDRSIGVISPVEWESLIMPGSRVTMSMYWVTRDSACPRCGSTEITSFRDCGWHQCARCKLIHAHTDTLLRSLSTTHSVAPVLEYEAALEHELVSDTSLEELHSRGNVYSEIKHFKRVHFDREEITRCVCGQDDSPNELVRERSDNMVVLGERIKDFFIQCDGCSVWQHGGCVGICDESSSPEDYYCEECKPDQHDLRTSSDGRHFSLYLPYALHGDRGIVRVESRKSTNQPQAKQQWRKVSKSNIGIIVDVGVCTTAPGTKEPIHRTAYHDEHSSGKGATVTSKNHDPESNWVSEPVRSLQEEHEILKPAIRSPNQQTVGKQSDQPKDVKAVRFDRITAPDDTTERQRPRQEIEPIIAEGIRKALRSNEGSALKDSNDGIKDPYGLNEVMRRNRLRHRRTADPLTVPPWGFATDG